MCLSSRQVANDMSLIASMTRRVRIYSISVCFNSTLQILQLAREKGMKVMVGVWLDRNLRSSDVQEFAALEAVVRQYADVISEIAVGNENLFSRNGNTAYLVSNILAARRIVAALRKSIPIGTVETEPIWMESNPALGFNMRAVAAAVDFVGVNFHPYYANIDPLVSNSGSALMGSHDRLNRKWNKRVIITEYGFPTSGPPHLGIRTPTTLSRLQAVITDVEPARRRQNVGAYFFEPFDGEWKTRWSFSGSTADSVEYHWGIMNCNRIPKIGIRLPPGGSV
jgi:exo-beta-1,3-glucanase (GH17 family)